MARAAWQHLDFLHARAGALVLLLMFAGHVGAASSVLIWPINPVIEAEQKAVALWLENRGQAPVNLQIRVMDWKQSDFEDRLDAQREVVGSPPVVTIAPGKRQMIRLMVMQAPQVGVQRAYRVLIDEMLDSNAAPDPQLGVKFQMRYSIPCSYSAAAPRRRAPPSRLARACRAWRPNSGTGFSSKAAHASCNCATTALPMRDCRR